MTGLVEWVSGLTLGELHFLVAAVSAFEGAFPILPGDFVAAFMAFLTARHGGSWLATTLWISTGAVLGNTAMYGMGRYYGADWFTKQMVRFKLVSSEGTAEGLEQRIERAYNRYGWVALFITRFVPGVRAFAPAVAGALRIPLLPMVLVLFVASLIWYGIITLIAFELGEDWETVKVTLERFVQSSGRVGAALAVVALIVAYGLWRRFRSKQLTVAAETEKKEG